MSEQIDIQDYMGQIRKMAVRALSNMNHRSGYTIEDMIGEGVLVFYKDALPRYVHEGDVGHRANFKSYLTTCLRNHYFGLMKWSFCQKMNDDTFEFDLDTGRMLEVRQDPKAVYTRRREDATIQTSPINKLIRKEQRDNFRALLQKISTTLDEREAKYLALAKQGMLPGQIRRELGVSSITEKKIRQRLRQKMEELTKC